jgi:hypothetical protein
MLKKELKRKNGKMMSPESDSNSKNNQFFEDLFLQVRNSQANNQFERIPKVLLSKIFAYLDLKNLSKLFLLNKFFLKILSESSTSINKLWKDYFDGDQIDEIQIESFLKEIEITEFDKRMNKNYLYLKV